MPWLAETMNERPAQVVDVRSPEQVTQDRARADTSAGLRAEYDRSLADPAFAIGSPEQQAAIERELIRTTANRTGAQGAGGSGYAKELAAKAVVDFRLGQLDKQRVARENLRNALVASSAPGGTPGQFQPAAPGVAGQAMNSAIGQVAQRGGTALGDTIFGSQKSAEQTGQPPAQPGGMGVQDPNREREMGGI